MTLIYVLLVAHFVGDFLCQTDWMALNKSKRWDALAVHVAAYISAVATVIGASMVVGLVRDPGAISLLWLAVNALAHFVQDAITSRINAALWFVDGVVLRDFHDQPCNAFHRAHSAEVAYNDKRHWFFVGIGADQLIHYVTLFVTASWWLQ